MIGKYYKPQPLDFSGDTDVYMKSMDENWDLIKKADLEAKKANRLEGRFIQEPIADGNAVYIVTRAGKRTCTVEVVTGIGDDWVIPSIGRVGSVRTDHVLQNIARRESIEDMFARKKAAKSS